MISHWLNRTLEVWRPVTAPDGAGGETVTMTDQESDVAAKVDQPSAVEQQVAAQWGSTHTHTIYCLPDVDVQRNDELRGDGQIFKVLATFQPSTPRYLKVQAELVEAGS